MIVAVNYHYIRPAYDFPFEAIYGVTCDDFERQLRLMRSVGELITPSDLLDCLKGKIVLPDRGWLLTFDDGLKEQYTYARPIIETVGAKAIYFVSTEPLDSRRAADVHKTQFLRAHVSTEDISEFLNRWMKDKEIELPPQTRSAAKEHYRYDKPDAAYIKYILNFSLGPAICAEAIADCFSNLLGWSDEILCDRLYMNIDQVRSLSESGQVGMHGHTHRSMGAIGRGAAEDDLRTAGRLLENWTARSPRLASFPFGDRKSCPDWLADVVGELGIEAAFTMERAWIGAESNRFFLPRIDVSDIWSADGPRRQFDRVFEDLPASSWYEGT